MDSGSIIAGLIGSDAEPVFWFLPASVVGLSMLIWVMKAADFRANRELLSAGLIVGLLVVMVWYLTAGPTGQALLEELDFMDQRPYAAGAQSFSFVAPSAYVAQYFYLGFSPDYLSFGVVLVVGVIMGSFLYTLIFSKLRIEWFASWKDFVSHVFGAILMGIGGVLGMGCTIGQGIPGIATLGLGSISPPLRLLPAARAQ